MTTRSTLTKLGLLASALSLAAIAVAAHAAPEAAPGSRAAPVEMMTRHQSVPGKIIVAEERDCWREFSQCEDRCVRLIGSDRHRCMKACSEDHNDCGN